tara:strand:+ start:377 stop:676 length:300 start_codon:yes stop_codon:yes gene_type:complete
MAPEVLSSQRYDESADVFSFGVCMWEMLTRECPFEGNNGIQCAMQVLNGARVEVPGWCRGGAPWLATLIEKCLSTDGKLRPTFEQISKAVAGSLEGRQI